MNFTSNPTIIAYLIILLITILSMDPVSGQVCSASGHFCTKGKDCCKGCCKSNTCMDDCSEAIAMASVPGGDSCDRLMCPPGQACFYREVCPPEDPCPRMPGCRSITNGSNNTGFESTYRLYRNSSNLRSSASNSIFAVILVGSLVLHLVDV